MSEQYRVLDPTKRGLITTIEPNNNAAPLLDDLVFRDGVSESNIIFSATDTPDVSFLNLSNINSVLLSVSENADTAASNIENIISVSFALTDTADAISITSDVDSYLSLNVQESADSALIRVRTREESKRNNGAANIIPLLLKLKKSNVALNVTEQADGAFFELTKESNIKARISERPDGVILFSNVIQNAQFAMAEHRDGVVVTPQDMKNFKAYVERKYMEYEEDQIRLILLVA